MANWQATIADLVLVCQRMELWLRLARFIMMDLEIYCQIADMFAYINTTRTKPSRKWFKRFQVLVQQDGTVLVETLTVKRLTSLVELVSVYPQMEPW